MELFLNIKLSKMKIGIIKEFKNPPDKRVVFTPKKCIEAKAWFRELVFFFH